MGNGEPTITLTETQVRKIIKESVAETLVSFGVNPKEPVELQKDFSFLREWRITTDTVKKRGLFTIIGMLVAGGLTLLWMGLQAALKAKGGGG